MMSATSAHRRIRGSGAVSPEIQKGAQRAASICAPGSPGDLIALQVVDAAAKGDLKAAIFAVRLDDEAAVVLSKSSTEEALTLPTKENLRFIADRLAGLLGEDD